jgi:hypothetical protein
LVQKQANQEKPRILDDKLIPDINAGATINIICVASVIGSKTG